MHYKNGRPARNGDKILLLNPYGGPSTVGILFDAKAEGGSDCNGNIAPINGGYVVSADLKNCLHLDDIAAAKIPDSSSNIVAAPAASGAYTEAPAPAAA